MNRSLSLYRSLVREAHKLDALPVQRKLCYNAKQLWSFYSRVQDPDRLHQLHEEAQAAVRVVRWLRELPQASGMTGWGAMSQRSRPTRTLTACTPPLALEPPPPDAAACRSTA
jgi:hypothetical protein